MQNRISRECFLKLCEMSNIFVAVKPLLQVSSLLGLAPLAVNEDSKSLDVSSWRSAYTLCVFAVFAANSGFGLYEKILKSKTSYTYIGEYASIVLLSCGIVVAMFSLLLAIVQRKKIAAVVNNFHALDAQLAKLDVQIPYDRFLRFSCSITSGLFLLLSVLFVHDYLVTRKSMTPCFWISYFGPVVVTTFVQCQFVSGGLLLKKNYACLNERLTQFGNENGLLEGERRKIEMVDVGYGHYFDSHLVRKTSQTPIAAWEKSISRYRPRKIVPEGDPVPPASLLTKIKIIRKIHSSLCETKDILNSSYSLQLLTTVAQAFVIITTNLYALFTSGGKKEENESVSYPIIWACFRAMELICVTVTCTKISKTANYTAVVVHKLLSLEWESNVRNQLKLFSIQLLHRKISFSASGFFTLDMTLLHTIIGAATTYLVILVQFHNMYETS